MEHMKTNTASASPASRPGALQKAPAELVQVTLLFDETGSMRRVEGAAQRSIDMVLADCRSKTGTVLAVRCFNDSLRTVCEFGEDADIQVNYFPNSTHTPLYGSIAESIEMSIRDADLTPEIKTHHMFVIVTDGKSEGEDDATLARARALMNRIDVNSTFILLDYSKLGNAGAKLGIESIRMTQTEANILEGCRRVIETVNQVSENVVRQLPPDTDLPLLPGK
jgi:hypothetical protein